jgi:hypothetical protein
MSSKSVHVNQKIFCAGFDNGYGSVKLFVDGFNPIRIAKKMKHINGGNTDSLKFSNTYKIRNPC